MSRFAHISDTHLGSVQYGIPEREQDFYDAFSEAIDTAMESQCEFIIHSGDLFDTGKPSNRALACLKNNMIKLEKKKIPVISIPGDHDRPRGSDTSAHELFDFLGLRIIGTQELEHVQLGDVNVAGIGNLKGFRRQQLDQVYVSANEMAGNWKKCIFISHQAVSPFFPEEQCETSRDKLPVNFTYMAFGHVHQFREEKVGTSMFSYAGSTEVKSTNEISGLMRQGKGINIVDLDDVAHVERKRIESARMQYEFRGNLDEILSQMEKIREKFIKKPLITMIITEKVDASTLKEKMDEYTDLFIFRRPIFNIATEGAPYVEFNPEHDTESLFKEYMKSNERGQLAHHIYRTLLTGNFTENEILEMVKGEKNDN